MNELKMEKRLEITGLLVEGMGIRSIARHCGVRGETILRLAHRIGSGCMRLHDEVMRDLPVPLLQVDEQWSFVRKKEAHRLDDDPEEWGDQWTYVALDVLHRAVISFHVGKRNKESAHTFIADIRRRVMGRAQVTSDGHRPYVAAFADAFGDDIDYAQLVKRYACDEREARGQPLGSKRYIGSMRQNISGRPIYADVSTSLVERFNLTTRMEQGRFGRRTLRHSKTLDAHKAAVALQYVHYNFCRPHEALRGAAPAVALGVSQRAWSLGELIETSLAYAPPRRTNPPPEPSDTAAPQLSLEDWAAMDENLLVFDRPTTWSAQTEVRHE